jgi:hypothetical protein
VAVQLAVRRVVTENSTIVPGAQVEIDEGKVVTNRVAIFILPHLFADQTVSRRTADNHRFVCDFDKPFKALLSRSHVTSIAQIGYFLSFLRVCLKSLDGMGFWNRRGEMAPAQSGLASQQVSICKLLIECESRWEAV